MVTIHECANKSDEELVKLTLDNQEWFLGIIERYQFKLLKYIRRISNVDPEEAEDLIVAVRDTHTPVAMEILRRFIDQYKEDHPQG